LRSQEQAVDGKVKKAVVAQVDFHESHYYLSSLDWSAREFSEAVRGHWLIENRLHWVKDVTLNEDNCIHRGGNAPACLGNGQTIFSIFSPDEWYEYSPRSFKIDGQPN